MDRHSVRLVVVGPVVRRRCAAEICRIRVAVWDAAAAVRVEDVVDQAAAVVVEAAEDSTELNGVVRRRHEPAAVTVVAEHRVIITGVKNAKTEL